MTALHKFKRELLVGASLLVALGAFVYKQAAFSSAWTQTKETEKKIAQIRRIEGYKALWHDKNIDKKLQTLGSQYREKRTLWKPERKKLEARYEGLTAKETDRLLSKFFRLPVRIVRFNLTKTDETYRVEWICAW
jgi:hypothetical protein